MHISVTKFELRAQLLVNEMSELPVRVQANGKCKFGNISPYIFLVVFLVLEPVVQVS